MEYHNVKSLLLDLESSKRVSAGADNTHTCAFTEATKKKGDLEMAQKLNEIFASVFTTYDLGQILLPGRHFLKKEFNEIQVHLLKPHRSPGESCLEAWKWFHRDSK